MCTPKICVVFVAIAACLLMAEAAVFSQPAIMHPGYPGKCFDKFTRRAMLPHKEYKPKGICAAMTCDIEARQINIETCPYVEMPGCEELPSDASWSFPKCCPQFKCVGWIGWRRRGWHSPRIKPRLC